MMNMRKTGLLILFLGSLLALPVRTDAQDIRDMLEGVAQKSGSACVTLTYRFSTSVDKAVIADEGYVEVQEGMWHLKGLAIEIYTDSTATWVIDPDAKEVIVEPAWTFDDLENCYSSALKSDDDMTLEILSESQTDMKPASCFTPSFGSEWVVTDLR